MRQKRNGFTKFMAQIEGRQEPKAYSFWYSYSRLNKKAINSAIVSILSNRVPHTLSNGFAWIRTPQGYGHWRDIYRGQAKATEEDIAYLEYLLEEHC